MFLFDIPFLIKNKKVVTTLVDEDHIVFSRKNPKIQQGGFDTFAIKSQDFIAYLASVSPSQGLTVATTTITGGTSTRILYNNNGVLGEYGVTGTGTTAVLSTSPTFITNITTPSVILSGNISAPAWTTSGIGLRTASRTLTDTTSSGTVAAAYTNLLGGNTIAATSATTFTNYYTTFISTPIAGANVIITNSWSLGLAGGLQVGGITNLGNAATTTQRVLRIGEGTSYMDFGQISAVFGGIWFQTINPSPTNYTFGGDGSFAVINAPSNSVLFRTAGTTWGSGTAALSSVSGGQFSLSALTSLGNTANSSVVKFFSYGSSTQWASGTTVNQFENSFTSPTYTGVAATVITNHGTVVSDFAISSTNMTITNNAAFYNPTRTLTNTTTGYGALFNAPSGASTNWAIGAIGGVTSTIGYGVGATPSSSRPINVAATVAGEYSLLITNLSAGASASSGVRFGNNSQQARILQGSTGATIGNGLYPSSLNFIQDDNGGFSFRQATIATSGAWTGFRFDGVAHTGQTASTNIPGILFTTGSRQYATGALATQTEFSITSPTYSFVGASVITNAFTFFVAAPTAGTLATITNSYAIGTTGSVNIASGNLFNSGIQVLSTRDTGWTAFTGASNKATSYATGSVTLIQLAERVAALQIALTTHGAIGA